MSENRIVTDSEMIVNVASDDNSFKQKQNVNVYNNIIIFINIMDSTSRGHWGTIIILYPVHFDFVIGRVLFHFPLQSTHCYVFNSSLFVLLYQSAYFV